MKEFTYKTRQLVEITNRIGNFYALEKGAYEDNPQVLAELISILANITREEAYDEIDGCLEEGKKISEIYQEIFDGINEKGFFKQKLEADLAVLPLDLAEATKELYTKYLGKEVEKVMDSQTM